MSATVIHRDHTFEYDGETYRVSRGGDYRSGWGWEVWRERDGAFVYDDFDRLSQVREYVDEHRANGWPLVPEPTDSGPT